MSSCRPREHPTWAPRSRACLPIGVLALAARSPGFSVSLINPTGVPAPHLKVQYCNHSPFALLRADYAPVSVPGSLQHLPLHGLPQAFLGSVFVLKYSVTRSRFPCSHLTSIRSPG